MQAHKVAANVIWSGVLACLVLGCGAPPSGPEDPTVEPTGESQGVRPDYLLLGCQVSPTTGKLLYPASCCLCSLVQENKYPYVCVEQGVACYPPSQGLQQ